MVLITITSRLKRKKAREAIDIVQKLILFINSGLCLIRDLTDVEKRLRWLSRFDHPQMLRAIYETKNQMDTGINSFQLCQCRPQTACGVFQSIQTCNVLHSH